MIRSAASFALAVALVFQAVAPAGAQPPPVPAPSPIAPVPPVPPAPPSPSSAMRQKISAGDLLSAESILEVHASTFGEDSLYLEGLAWLARGALLLGDPAKAHRLGADVRERCEARLAAGADLRRDRRLATALGAAIEVEAQLRATENGRDRAVAYVREELDRWDGPVTLRSRLYKRLNLLALAGTRPPELVVEESVGAQPHSLAQLRGRPVVLYLWAEWCGDCKAQAATLDRVHARYADRGLQVIALTRYTDDDPVAEKARIEKAWKDGYPSLSGAPVVISTASMERFGGSSTPTFVFIGRDGNVRGYTPTRLTEGALDRAVAELFEQDRAK